MYTTTTTKSRSATTTCTKSRVAAVLDVFLGDLVGLMCREVLATERAVRWVRDLGDVLVLEAVQRFQVKLTLPDGSLRALDYEVSDTGKISTSDGCGGFATYWIPKATRVGLVLEWREDAPRLAEARKLLQHRGWGTGTLLEADGAPDRAYSKDGYGFYRRTVGEWPV